jgi:predicted 3-demethylubiquinone-9 3-methyltransferase (glyoxalase superfamily)
MRQIQKISPCLWFDHQAEEAASFYTSIFRNSKIGEWLRPCARRRPRSGSIFNASERRDFVAVFSDGTLVEY